MRRLPPVLAIRKTVGSTPHRMAMDLSRRHGTVVTHTGNLDPMAEGVMVFLVGAEAIRDQAHWQAADKAYEFDVLFGFSTDTGDQLGLVESSEHYESRMVNKDNIKGWIKKWAGLRRLENPVYSRKMVRGKPLYWWARRGRLGEITVPVSDVRIHSAALVGLRSIGKKALAAGIRRNVTRVAGDFRQNDILERWKEELDRHPNERFSVARIRVDCSKGTYVRSLARRLGESLGIPSIALRIVRTRVGPVRLSDCSSWSEGAA